MPDNTELNHEAIQDIALLVTEAQTPTFYEKDHADFAIFSNSKTIQSLEQFRSNPFRIREAPVFIDTKSFAIYVNRFKSEATLVRGFQDKGNIVAFLDYHKGNTFTSPAPSWNTHQATLNMQKTEDWKAWESGNGKAIGQAEFARFIERFDHCIIEPDTATLIEMIERMDVTSGMIFQSKVNRVDGSIQFTYQDEKQLVGTLKVPTKFYISVAPFESNKPQNVEVLLRYRINDGHLSFMYDLPEFSKIQREAFLAVCAEVTDLTDIEVLR